MSLEAWPFAHGAADHLPPHSHQDLPSVVQNLICTLHKHMQLKVPHTSISLEEESNKPTAPPSPYSACGPGLLLSLRKPAYFC